MKMKKCGLRGGESLESPLDPLMYITPNPLDSDATFAQYEQNLGSVHKTVLPAVLQFVEAQWDICLSWK